MHRRSDGLGRRASHSRRTHRGGGLESQDGWCPQRRRRPSTTQFVRRVLKEAGPRAPAPAPREIWPSGPKPDRRQDRRHRGRNDYRRATELAGALREATEAADRRALLQVHPLESTGRATETLAGAVPDAVEAAFANLAAAAVEDASGGRLRVQLDLIDVELLAADPARVFADPTTPDRRQPLADLVSPLVVEADGTIVPVRYGFGRRYALGNATQARLSELARGWKLGRMDRFRSVCRAAFEGLVARADRYANWYDAVVAASIGTPDDSPYQDVLPAEA